MIIFHLSEFFISVLADGFRLEFEWKQVSSSLQDSSQYFGYCNLTKGYRMINNQNGLNPIILLPAMGK